MAPFRTRRKAIAIPRLPPQLRKGRAQISNLLQLLRPSLRRRRRIRAPFQITSTNTNTNNSAFLSEFSSSPSSSSPLSSVQNIVSFSQQRPGAEFTTRFARLTLTDFLPLLSSSPSANEASGGGIPMATTATDSFHEFLKRLQHGTEPTVEFRTHKDYIRIPDAYLFNPYASTGSKSKGSIHTRFFKHFYQDISSTRFPSSSSTSSPFSCQYGKRMILTTFAEQAKAYNNIGFNSLPSCSEVKPCWSKIVPSPAGNLLCPIDNKWMLQDFQKYPPAEEPRRPPWTLRLKIGFPIMLLEDIDGERAGTVVTVEKLEEDAISARVTTEMVSPSCRRKGKGKARVVGMGTRVIQIERQEYVVSTNTKPLIEYRRQQFPVKPAFALAADHVPEGMMFDELGLDLTHPLKAPGQLHSTLLRCRDPSRLKVLVTAPKGQVDGYQGLYTRNVVPCSP